MTRFTVPYWVRQHAAHGQAGFPSALTIESLRRDLQKLQADKPIASVVIPAYNEESNIVQTLSSLAKLKSRYPLEILVVNNNSTDRTQQILDSLGVRSVFEPRQGISTTRQTGLENARGRYILSADADSIYPTGWADALIDKLQNPQIACAYGRYSFIPSADASRLPLGMYELMAEALFKLRERNRHYLNVLGFNFAFRKADGLRVGGYDTSFQRWQDGRMAKALMAMGEIALVPSHHARVWTSDRRLKDDGSLFQAFVKRVKKQVSRLNEYVALR